MNDIRVIDRSGYIHAINQCTASPKLLHHVHEFHASSNVSCRTLPLLLSLLLPRRFRLQLQSVNPPLTAHLLLQQSVDQAMPRRLHFRLERGGRNRDTSPQQGLESISCLGTWWTAESRRERQGSGYALEMRLLGGDALHRNVVRVEVGVVADDEGGGGEGVGELYIITV